jgi:inosine triphosphate pyrophosphatase
MIEINIVTTNEDKFREIKFIMEGMLSDIKLNIVKVDYFHIQELQGEHTEIIIAKCKEAFNYIKGITVVEDTSFAVDCLNGLPGPYIRDFFLKLGNNGFYTVCKGFTQDKITATEECFVAICKDDDVKVFSGAINGTVVEPQNSIENEYNWNYFFIPDGCDETYGGMNVEKKCKNSGRRIAVIKLCEYIKAENYFNIINNT